MKEQDNNGIYKAGSKQECVVTKNNVTINRFTNAWEMLSRPSFGLA